MIRRLDEKSATFDGRLLMIGFGAIGQGVLPLLLRHIDMEPHRISIISPDGAGRALAASHGVTVLEWTITPGNFQEALTGQLGPGDFLLNLSVNVSSSALILWCRDHEVLYLDACNSPWEGGWSDPSLSPEQRSNLALRIGVQRLRQVDKPSPTAVLAHGVNPGLVSHFVKQALLNLAADLLPETPEPGTREDWARLAWRLGVRVIHIAERDTQTSPSRKQPGEFVNTWSVDGFIGEACQQPAELGWGSHERLPPAQAHAHGQGTQAAIWLERPGAATRVRSWTPLAGPYLGFLVTHEESFSLAEYLTLSEDGAISYRPTVHYAYYPCDDALLSLHELAGRNWEPQPRQRILGADDIDAGMDELGVLLLGHARNAYWYGSRLTIDQARVLCPHNNATTLQTAAGVLSGVIWAIQHPRAGLVDPDELDFREVLAVARPYLGEMVGIYADWTPLQGRSRLFPEDIDTEDPWQFNNFLV
jgi:homospermidine synthase